MRLLCECYVRDVPERSEFILDGTTYRVMEQADTYAIVKLVSDYFITYNQAIEFLKNPHDDFPHKGENMFMPNKNIVIMEMPTYGAVNPNKGY